jgi:hypothetical protein
MIKNACELIVQPEITYMLHLSASFFGPSLVTIVLNFVFLEVAYMNYTLFSFTCFWTYKGYPDPCIPFGLAF